MYLSQLKFLPTYHLKCFLSMTHNEMAKTQIFLKKKKDYGGWDFLHLKSTCKGARYIKINNKQEVSYKNNERGAIYKFYSEGEVRVGKVEMGWFNIGCKEKLRVLQKNKGKRSSWDSLLTVIRYGAYYTLILLCYCLVFSVKSECKYKLNGWKILAQVGTYLAVLLCVLSDTSHAIINLDITLINFSFFFSLSLSRSLKRK